jgi:hypothetical protein
MKLPLVLPIVPLPAVALVALQPARARTLPAHLREEASAGD